MLGYDLICIACGRDFSNNRGDKDIFPAAPCPSEDCPGLAVTSTNTIKQLRYSRELLERAISDIVLRTPLDKKIPRWALAAECFLRTDMVPEKGTRTDPEDGLRKTKEKLNALNEKMVRAGAQVEYAEETYVALKHLREEALEEMDYYTRQLRKSTDL